MTKPKSRLHETYKGYEIRHRYWLKRRPWRAQLPDPEGRTVWCDVASLQAARALIDRSLLLEKLTERWWGKGR